MTPVLLLLLVLTIAVLALMWGGGMGPAVRMVVTIILVIAWLFYFMPNVGHLR